jgi:RNA polymerase sigma-70 factor (ECF subfamily)
MNTQEEIEQTLEDLRRILSRGLRFALAGRVLETHLESLIEDSVQEALLKILDNLDSFEGRSRFTTWANKITVRVALTELRRQRWKDVSLQDLLPEEHSVDYTPPVLTDSSPNPEERASQAAVMSMVQRLLTEELTERQREAMMAVMLGGMPLEEVARRMGTNRNALYKLIHDARKRLKARLADEGYTPQELLSVFETE